MHVVAAIAQRHAEADDIAMVSCERLCLPPMKVPLIGLALTCQHDGQCNDCSCLCHHREVSVEGTAETRPIKNNVNQK